MQVGWSSRAAAVVAGGLAASVVLASAAIRAESVLNLQFHTFQDSRGVTVLEPIVDLDKDFTDRSGLKVKFGVDAITAASDSCARCHPDGHSSGRTFVNFDYRRKFGAFKVDVGGEISRENFYAADTALVSVSRDLNKGNTTIAGGYSFSLNRPQLHPTQTVENQYAHDLFASLTQTLTRGTIVQLAYDYNRISGFQSNPFLRTSVDNLMVVGNAPDLRTRQAIVVRLRQALPAATYLETDYRRYTDSWSVHSNTVSVGLEHYFRPTLLVGFTYRWYDQTAAFFYQPFYLGSPEFYTGDFRLAPFNAGTYSGHVLYTPANRLFDLLPDKTALDLRYDRYLASTGFQAAMFSFGLRVPF
ncbi:MAG TPA: DUF3570 domain-containing protein [Vicinamibacterales bacterium]